jgi:hypothetical protein
VRAGRAEHGWQLFGCAETMSLWTTYRGISQINTESRCAETGEQVALRCLVSERDILVSRFAARYRAYRRALLGLGADTSVSVHWSNSSMSLRMCAGPSPTSKRGPGYAAVRLVMLSNAQPSCFPSPVLQPD